jgi:hypothetical protein
LGPQLVPPGEHRTGGKPVILIEPPWEPIIEQVMEGIYQLNYGEPQLFVRGGLLFQVIADENGKYSMRQVTLDAMLIVIDRAAAFYKISDNGPIRVFPPQRLVGLVIATVGELLRDQPNRLKLPKIIGIAETPVVRPDGTILLMHKPGYDSDTFLYCALNPSLMNLNVPQAPTADDLKWARDTLHDALDDFCFSEPKNVNFANVVMALLTLLLRLVIADQIPILMINATTPGTGKTLLAKFISAICLGHVETLTTAPSGREVGEWRKRIIGFLREGSNIVIVDNLAFTIESADLCAAVTAPVFGDRLLGTNTTLRASTTGCFWIFTGNGLRPIGDLVRRCYWVQMDPQVSDPTQRTNFKHGHDAEFIRWALEQRGQILRALLILSRHWFVSGCPPCNTPRIFGGFSRWAQLAAILECGGIDGALQNTGDIYIDPKGEEWQDFLEVIDQVTYGSEFTVVTLRNILRDKTWNPNVQPFGRLEPSTNAQKLRDALPDGLAQLADKPDFTPELGIAFRQQRDRRYGATGIRIVTVLDANGKVKKEHNKNVWKIETN